MSGLEVVPAISAAIEIIGALKKVYEAIKNRKGLPKAFAEVNKGLPFVETILNKAETVANTAKIDVDEAKLIKETVEDCTKNLTKLKEIFNKVNKAKGKKIKEVYVQLVLQFGEGHRVEDLMKSVSAGVQNLTANQVFEAATKDQVGELVTYIEELKKVEPSVDDKKFGGPGNSFEFSGKNSINNVATGPGDNAPGGAVIKGGKIRQLYVGSSRASESDDDGSDSSEVD